GGRKRGENRGNKLVLLLTVHQVPGAIILPAEGLDAEAAVFVVGLPCPLGDGR
ncbi:Glutamate racemase, partial [Dissostichus eleginoides]